MMAVQPVPAPPRRETVGNGYRRGIHSVSDQKTQINQHHNRAPRDSSADSGIHAPSSHSPQFNNSDTDSEIQDVFSSNKLVPVDIGTGGPNETNRLVEEEYFAQDSLQHVENVDSRVKVETSPPAGTFHASPFLNSEEEMSSSETSADLRPTRNVHILSTFMSEAVNQSLPLQNPFKTVQGRRDEAQGRVYVNQAEFETKVQKIPISSVVSASLQKAGDHQVVVAIDLGTTYSGYAYSHINHHFDKEIHMMRKWEGGDPGLNNQKIPTTMLLTPQGKFHSFGFEARDFYHDLEPQEASSWFYFDKFKKILHNNPNVRKDTKVLAANGESFNAVEIFSMALRYLSQQALAELADQGSRVSAQVVRWVVTVPAIWSQAAKQIIREAAYQAGFCTSENRDALMIALEPEAAAVWCKNLRFDQLDTSKHFSKDDYLKTNQGSCFMVVDCGGGTVDVTVHKLHCPRGPLKELYKASGEPCGSLGVDEEFDHLLGSVFGFPFMTQLRIERPAAYTELMLSFESRKRSILPARSSTLNVSLPFAFIDFYQNQMGKKIEDAVKNYGQEDLNWSSQGMLKISPRLMMQLFKPTIDNIVKHVAEILTTPEVSSSISCVFLVGGFSESGLLQEAIKKKLEELKLPPPIIPQGVALCVLRGAVLYGMNPEVVIMRKSQHTYGIGVLKPFQKGVHPLEKLVLRDSREWCADVFDILVSVNQDLYAGESVLRRYTPANSSQSAIILHIYCSQSAAPQFVTDEGVQRVGTLKLDLRSELGRNHPRELLARLVFSSTELTVSVMDLETASYTDTSLTFLD